MKWGGSECLGVDLLKLRHGRALAKQRDQIGMVISIGNGGFGGGERKRRRGGCGG